MQTTTQAAIEAAKAAVMARRKVESPVKCENSAANTKSEWNYIIAANIQLEGHQINTINFDFEIEVRSILFTCVNWEVL